MAQLQRKQPTNTCVENLLEGAIPTIPRIYAHAVTIQVAIMHMRLRQAVQRTCVMRTPTGITHRRTSHIPCNYPFARALRLDDLRSELKRAHSFKTNVVWYVWRLPDNDFFPTKSVTSQMAA